MTIVKVCSGCGRTIDDAYNLVLDSKYYWHPACLRCSQCSCTLEQLSKCYADKQTGKLYCPSDYAKLVQLSSMSASEMSGVGVNG
jgi:hypothetical protein